MRRERHTVEYFCDRCPSDCVVWSESHAPSEGEARLPDGWLSLWLNSHQNVHFCSAKCLREYANKTRESP